MLLPRSRRSSFCFLVITAILFVFFQRFRQPDELDFILEDDIINPPHHQRPPPTDTFDPDLDPEPVPQQRPRPIPEKSREKLRTALGKHKFRSDGLLEVNLEGPHPIYELISRAEKEWEQKLLRASKTFQELVQEYERRYKRPPPKGFDLW